jgi:hypothetical protein
MASTLQHDKSNGYEQLAETFIRTRNRRIGAVTVREWSETLPPASFIVPGDLPVTSRIAILQ